MAISGIGGGDSFQRTPGVSKNVQHHEAGANPQVGQDGFAGTAPALEKTARPTAVPKTMAMEAVADTGGIASFGLGTFTNGLGSNEIVGLSGRVLASASPFKLTE